MKMKIGDRVETIDDNIVGVVIKISGDIITIKDPDGFEMQFNPSELMITHTLQDIEKSIYNADISSIKKEKELFGKKRVPKVKPKERSTPKLIIDLHIHHLTDSTKNMTNFDMLNLQLDTAKRQLEFAIKKRIPKVVFIHGVGEGVLRQELETLFNRYNNVQFYDADYKTYGLGATEVRIFQNLEP